MAEVPNLFAVISWGNAGTHWLTKLLNAHPEVLCLHNLRNKLEPRKGIRVNRYVRYLTRRFTGSVSYLEILRREGSPYRLVGDVHGVSISDLPRLRGTYGERIRFAVLTRHPVLRVRSQLNLAARSGSRKQLILYRRLRSSLPQDLAQTLTSREELFFVHVCRLVTQVGEEAKVGPLFGVEQLSADPGRADALLAHLSQGELSFPNGLVETLAKRHVVSHSPDKQTDEPAVVFAELPRWQQDTFRRLLDPDSRKRYEELGYDLSFV